MTDVSARLTIDEAAAYLKLSPGTLASWRSQRRSPAYYKIGRSIQYKRSDLDAWMEEQKRESIREPVAIDSRLPVANGTRDSRRPSRLGGYKTQLEKAERLKQK